MKRLIFITLFISLLIVGCAKASDPVSNDGETNNLLTEETRIQLNGFGVGLDVGEDYIAVAEEYAGLSLINKETLDRKWFTFIKSDDGSVTGLGRNRTIHLLGSLDLVLFTEEVATDNIRVASIANPDTLFTVIGITGGTYAIKQIQIDPYTDPNPGEFHNYVAKGFFCNGNAVTAMGWNSVPNSLEYNTDAFKTYSFPTSINSAIMQNEVIYAAAGQRGVFIHDMVTDVTLAEIDTPDEAYAIEVKGNRLFVADNRSGLLVYDISDLNNVSLAFEYNTLGYAKTLSSNDTHMVMTSTSGGIYLFDISNEEDIKFVEKHHPGYCNKAQIDGDKLYVVTKDGELIIYNF